MFMRKRMISIFGAAVVATLASHSVATFGHDYNHARKHTRTTKKALDVESDVAPRYENSEASRYMNGWSAPAGH